MPKVMTCDICGADDADEDYEGNILCTYHHAVRRLQFEEEEYKEKRDWVKKIWFAELKDRRARIAELKQIIEDNKPQ